MENIQKEPSIFILFLLVSFSSVLAILFTPALPEIALKMGLDDTLAQTTISVFLIGYAIGQLLYGPLSNRLGRKPTVYLGASIAILGCLMVQLVDTFHSFSLLIIGRLIMALGSSVGMKIAFTMVGDVYQNEKATKKISYLILSFAITPALAVAIAGMLTTHFGYASCFYFQTAYCILLLSLSFFLPETCSGIDQHGLELKKIAESYLEKFKDKKLVMAAILMGCNSSVFYLFASEAPFIGVSRIGLSPHDYGLLNSIPLTGLIMGSLVANALAGKRGPFSVMLLGISIATVFSILNLMLFSYGVVTIWSLFLPVPFLLLGTTLVFSNASSMTMSQAKDKSYTSATMGFINMGLSVVVLLVFESLPFHGVLMMPVMFTLIALLMMILRYRLKRMQ